MSEFIEIIDIYNKSWVIAVSDISSVKQVNKEDFCCLVFLKSDLEFSLKVKDTFADIKAKLKIINYEMD